MGFSHGEHEALRQTKGGHRRQTSRLCCRHSNIRHPKICVWRLLSLCSFLCVYGFRHVLGGCCASVALRAFRRFRISNFPRLGATIATILILWQISFLGIRVGEASNPGPTMSNSVPVSDGVTTPLPQFQDQDLEISVPGLASHPPGSLSVTAPSLSLAPVAPPYVPVPLSRSLSSFVLLASVPFPGLVLLLAALPARPALLLTAAVPLLRLPLSLCQVSLRVLLLPTPVTGFSVRSHPVPTMLVPLTGGPHSAPCARTSMLISQGSSLVTFRWTGFVVLGSALARYAKRF